MIQFREHHDPDISGEGAQDRIEGQEVPFRHDMRRRYQRVCLDVVVRVTQIVGHEADNREEDHQNQRQCEQVLHHEVGPEGQGVLLRVFLGGAAHLNPGRVVVAGRVKGPDMHGYQRRDHKGQQVVQREEAVQRGIVHGRSAQQPSLKRVADEGNGTEQTGNHRCTPEGHLTPWQNIAHEGCRHHQQIDEHADDPGDLARCLVAAVVEPPENVQVDGKQRTAMHHSGADTAAYGHRFTFRMICSTEAKAKSTCGV